MNSVCQQIREHRWNKQILKKNYTDNLNLNWLKKKKSQSSLKEIGLVIKSL